MTATTVEPLHVEVPDDQLQQSRGSRIARIVVWLALAMLALAVPLMLAQFHSRRWSLAVIFAIVALSLNTLIGHAGQVSLGHQGFLGVGAFVAAYVVTTQGQPFFVALLAGAMSGGIASAVLGLVALRVRGLYLALVTLAYGRMAQEALFNLPVFGSGAGIEAARPAFVGTERSYYYVCLVALVLVLYIDWRFTSSKAGRAVAALRENEQVASSLAITVNTFKLFAFVLSGLFVGLAGALYAFRNQRVVGNDFEFTLALFFVIVTVVGGVRSRAGVVLWTITFTLLPDYLSDQFSGAPQLSRALGAGLLIVILARFPGGVGQLIQPITTWMTGGPLKWTIKEAYVEEGVRGRP